MIAMSGQAFERFLPPTRQITDALQFLIGGFMLTQERLKEVLHYDPETGIFTWAVRTSNRVRVGDIAGCDDGRGYLQIKIDGVLHRVHRLAWLYMTGEFPTFLVDHENGIVSDSRWKNLRDATKIRNGQNRRKANKNNLTGLLGVSRHGNQFRAIIHTGKVRTRIGDYASPELAHAAYVEAKRRLHQFCTI